MEGTFFTTQTKEELLLLLSKVTDLETYSNDELDEISDKLWEIKNERRIKLLKEKFSALFPKSKDLISKIQDFSFSPESKRTLWIDFEGLEIEIHLYIGAPFHVGTIKIVDDWNDILYKWDDVAGEYGETSDQYMTFIQELKTSPVMIRRSLDFLHQDKSLKWHSFWDEEIAKTSK